jgi:hypothetical protein
MNGLLLIDNVALTNGVALLLMQLGSRNFNFTFTGAQKKILQHPYVQVVLLIAIFYAPTRNILLSAFIVAIYYLATTVLFNEVHPMNIYSKTWLMKEGFIMPKDKV